MRIVLVHFNSCLRTGQIAGQRLPEPSCHSQQEIDGHTDIGSVNRYVLKKLDAQTVREEFVLAPSSIFFLIPAVYNGMEKCLHAYIQKPGQLWAVLMCSKASGSVAICHVQHYNAEAQIPFSSYRSDSPAETLTFWNASFSRTPKKCWQLLPRGAESPSAAPRGWTFNYTQHVGLSDKILTE